MSWKSSKKLTPSLCFRSYHFKMEEVEPFRYRARDAWRAVTKFSIREARIKEIKTEMFNSEKLKVCCSIRTIITEHANRQNEIDQAS